MVASCFYRHPFQPSAATKISDLCYLSALYVLLDERRWLLYGFEDLYAVIVRL